jgi:ribosome-binding factor A
VAVSRTERVGEQLRNDIAELLLFTVRDPAIGFITITRVSVTGDLQQARVYYTTMGDDRARRETQRGLERASPMIRRHLGQRLRLRRVPELRFFFDESVGRQDRIEQILRELEEERSARGPVGEPAGEPQAPEEPPSDEPDGDE